MAKVEPELKTTPSAAVIVPPVLNVLLVHAPPDTVAPLGMVMYEEEAGVSVAAVPLWLIVSSVPEP